VGAPQSPRADGQGARSCHRRLSSRARAQRNSEAADRCHQVGPEVNHRGFRTFAEAGGSRKIFADVEGRKACKEAKPVSSRAARPRKKTWAR